MTDEEIGRALLEVFEERAELAATEGGPNLIVTSTYICLQVCGVCVWDNEDDNSCAEHGLTTESELAHAEANMQDRITDLQALVTAPEQDDE